ncbi:unnamed protein product, partial [Mesorhabditis belari]|uniref:C3H1-type domain-containing protein n=1 Tax=Mesorhabditis belari TaxID=2138241 RepID=A0AAF3FMS7_9BILA
MADSRDDNNGFSEQKSEGPERKDGGRDSGRDRDDVCRDFLKNICNRGRNCKFYHPPDAEKPSETQIHFCIDYQNRGCTRNQCRFVHVPKEEAERYKATREVNLPLARAIAAVTNGDTINGIPVCKEFQTGKCGRGAARCRYWHVNLEEERERRRRGLPMGAPLHGGGGGGRMGNYGGGGGSYGPPMGGMRRPAPPIDDYYAETKRARMDDQRVTELERRCAEQQKEIEGLKRELQREHERYEDLYALFRQQTAGGGGGGGVSSAPSYGQPGQANWGTTWP